MTHANPHHPLVLTVLQRVTIDRLQRAVNALAEGSMIVILTRQSETEIRALVRNGEGKEYGCTITESLTTCSCRDALYRGVTCKHATVLALQVLRAPQEESSARTIHLVLTGSTALCGARNPSHCWHWPYWPETDWKETCPNCEAIRKQPVFTKTVAAAA